MSDESVPEEKLTRKEQVFILEYLSDFNATRAAIAAGYSERSARSIGYENLTKPHIYLKIEAILEERKKRLKIDQERVIRELEHIAFARMRNFVEVKAGRVNVKDNVDMDDNLDAAIKSYSETTTEHGGSLSVTLHDKNKALELLCKILGIDKLPKEGDRSSLEELLMASLIKKEENNGTKT